MFEKPQYLTPGGYRRSKRNPIHSPAHKKALIQKGLSSTLLPPLRSNNGQFTISKEAAKLIALTIKGMLRR